MKGEEEAMLSLIQAAFFGKEIKDKITEETFLEMKRHAIVALPASVLLSSNLDESLLQEWKFSILQVVTYNTQYMDFLSKLPITVPYVILKGTSAAQYYPHPEYRALGDIDIITSREDYQII